MNEVKRCSRCKKQKWLAEFSSDKTSKDGLQHKCRDCEAAHKRLKRRGIKEQNVQQQVERLQRVLKKAAGGPLPRPTRNRSKAAAGIAPIVILSDVHVPEHDKRFWRAVLRWIAEHRPSEIVLSGDFGEFASVSQHGGTNEAKLIDDLNDVRIALDQLREAGGADCQITYLEGNHESRLPRAVASWAPSFTSAIDLPNMLGLERRGIRWVPEYQQPILRGNLRILHGHQVLGKYGPRHHAAKAADVYGSTTFSEVVYGHVHATQTFTKPVIGGYVSATALGCGRTIGADHVRWLAGREAGWHHGFGVAYVVDGLVSLYSVKVRDGQFVWSGRLYDGREA